MRVKRFFVAAILFPVLLLFGFISAKQCVEVDDDGRIEDAFCSSQDNIREVLVDLIEREQESIKITAFRFSDSSIAHAVADAMVRGIEIQMVVDVGCVSDRYERVSYLTRRGLVAHVYEPYHMPDKSFRPLMHDKLFIFGRNILDRKICCTGSLNPTHYGCFFNRENILVLDNPRVCEKFEREFEILMASSNEWVSTKGKKAKK